MIDRVISGGQTGVDLSALTSASALGIPTGGFAPLGWETEEGPAPWLADYNLREHKQPGYPARTESNILNSQGTLLITYETKLSGGSYLTACLCESLDRPLYIIRIGKNGAPALPAPGESAWTGPGYVSTTPSKSKLSFPLWMGIHSIKVLNIAGPRESKCPGIFDRASELLLDLLTQLP